MKSHHSQRRHPNPVPTALHSQDPPPSYPILQTKWHHASNYHHTYGVQLIDWKSVKDRTLSTHLLLQIPQTRPHFPVSSRHVFAPVHPCQRICELSVLSSQNMTLTEIGRDYACRPSLT